MRPLPLFLAIGTIVFVVALPIVRNLRAVGASTKDRTTEQARAWSNAWKHRLQSPQLSPEEFTQLFAEAMRSRVRGAKVDASAPLTVEARLPNGMETTTHLDNAWSECREDPSARIEWYERLLRSLPVTSPTPDVGARNIVPLIRDHEFLNQVPRGGSVKAEHLVADLWIVYAEDSPQSLRYLPGDIPTSIPELRQRAIRYLRSALPDIQRHGGGPCYMLTAGGNFEASLLLLDEIWDQQAKQVKGELVAAVPSRDVVMFTGSDSPAGLAELRTAVHRIHSSGSYPVSETLLVWRHGSWQGYAPSGA